MRLDLRIAFWIAVPLAAALLLNLFSGVVMPFAAALALGYVLDPVADRLERLGLSRLSAALVIIGAFLVLLAVFVLAVAPILGRQLTGLAAALPDYAARLQALVTTEIASLTTRYGGGRLGSLGLAVDPEGIQKQAAGFAAEGVQWLGRLARGLWSGGQALVGAASLAVVTPVATFYILVDWRKMVGTMESLVPPRHIPTVMTLAGEIDRALAGFLRGQSLVCLFLGLWYGVGLTLVGLNFGFLVGVSAGLLSFIPYVGSLTALFLSVVIALVQGWPSPRLLAMALGVVFAGQFLEGNVLSPRLVGHSVGLHPVWLMFALLACGSLFGFTGLIVAVPLAASLGVLIRFAAKRYRDSPLYIG